VNLDIRQILSILFAVLLTWLLLFFYSCSASFHLNKAIKKGAQIETRIDTIRYYFKDREEIKQDAKTDRKEIAKEKKTSFSSTLKFLGIILGLVLLIIVLLKSNKKIGL